MGSWDYMGDEYDEGDDCYYNWEVGELISYEGSNFRINMSSFFSEESEEATVSITVDGNLLSMSEPGDNDFTEEYSKDNRSVSNLTPKCSDSPKLKSDEMRDKVRMLFSN
jgi:hypothetical protein